MNTVRKVALYTLSLFFVVAGANHFINPEFYIAIMPPYLPAHRALVYLSGILEMAGGLAVLVPSIRSEAGWALVLLLVAIFPANVHMAMNPELYPDLPVAGLYARLPLQLVFIGWAYWATRPAEPAAAR